MTFAVYIQPNSSTIRFPRQHARRTEENAMRNTKTGVETNWRRGSPARFESALEMTSPATEATDAGDMEGVSNFSAQTLFADLADPASASNPVRRSGWL